MALEALLMHAARVTWRRRMLWVLGLAATAGALLFNLLLRSVAWYTTDDLAAPNFDLLDTTERVLDPQRLIGGVVGLFLLGLAFWLISAVVEGGLIVAVRDGDDIGQITLGQALRAGLGLVGRFIGIDTVLFLPLFLLALVLMLAGFGGLFGLVLVVTGPAAQAGDLLLVAGLTMLVSAPVLVLMLVVTVVILVLRMLAFRAAAVEGLSTRDSIRRSWSLARHHFWAVAVLSLVLWAIRSVVGMPVRLLTLAAAGGGLVLTAMAATNPTAETGALSLLLGLGGSLLALVSWLVSGIMNAYGSASWTLAYQMWTAESL